MPEICPVEPHDESEIPDLLHLAKIYEGGLGKLWRSKTEATRILAITYPRIRREHLTWASPIMEFPAEVLDLFKSVGISIWVVRALCDARKAWGLPVLLEKAATVKALNKDLSRAQLVGMLTAGICPQFDARPTPNQFNHKKIAKSYRRGLEDGRWSSFSGAEALLGINRGVIAAACEFFDLPLQVRRLFSDKTCTYDSCRKVLEIEKALGRKALIERATLISKSAHQDVPGADVVIRLLAGFVHNSAAVTPRIRIPRQQRKLIVELHCDDSRFLLDRSNQLMKIVETGLASLIEAALATLGTSPVLSKK
jgi:hypothetical protein